MMVGLARTNRGKEAVSVRHLFDKIAQSVFLHASKKEHLLTKKGPLPLLQMYFSAYVHGKMIR